MSDQLVESPMEESPELSASSAAEDAPEAPPVTAAADSSSTDGEAPADASEAAAASADEAESSPEAQTAEDPVEAASAPEAAEASSSEEASEDSAAAEQAKESESAGSEASGTEVSGTEVSGTEAASTEASGTEAPSPEAASTEASEAPTEVAAATAATASDEAASAAEAPTATDSAGDQASDAAAKAEAQSAEMIVLQKALEDESLVEGQVIGWNKGGYHVAIGKIAAFCPVSQIEIGNPRAPKRYLDKTFKFRVIEIQDGGRRVVVSRSAALEAERTAKASEVRDKLTKGAVLEGRVSSLTDFGAFVNLGGGIEGLVHISEISRRRVEHPKEVLKHRQKVKVSVLKVENDGNRISLSMKALEADPWKGVADRFEVGGEFEGTILRKTDFGLFVEVEPGLEGLVHVSRLPIGADVEGESLEIGQTVKGWVHEVDAKRRRLSLSLREVAADDPWKGIEERHREGEIITGKVERVANFGAFVEIEPGLTGLLSFSAVSAAPNANLRRQYHPGREVKVRILSIDKGRKRISLGTELSKAEGSQQDYREYLKQQKKSGSGLNALAAAFEKLKR